MHQLGGWWLDLDVLLLRPDLPSGAEFFACDVRRAMVTAILKFPRGHPLLAEAINRSRGIDEKTALWGETGPQLLTELISKFGLDAEVKPPSTVYPFDYDEIEAIFDPARCDEVRERCRNAWFCHIFNEVRRQSGFPRDAGPPENSYLDRLFAEYDLGIRFPYCLHLPELRRWLGNQYAHNTYKALYETTKRELERLRLCAERSAG